MQMISVDDCQLTILDGKKVCQNLMKSLLKNFDEDNDKRCILKVDVKYPKSLQLFTCLMKKMKIKKCNKLVCNMYDKNIYVTHIKNTL